MKAMNKKIWTVLYVIAFIGATFLICASLSGCQLAIQDKGSADPGDIVDEFRGFYITFSRLPLDRAKAPEGNRIYAEEKTGDEPGKIRYEFGGIEGIPFFLASVPIKGTDESCLFTISDNHIISDVHMDVGSGTRMSGRLYLSHDFFGGLYFYPVFQKRDGRIYLDAARGEVVGASNAASARYAFEAKTTISDGDKKQEITNKAEVIIEYMNSLEKIVFKEMNSLDEVVVVTEAAKGQIMKAVHLNENTAYILVEEHGVDHRGEAAVVRSLLERDPLNMDIRFLCRFMDDRGIAEVYEVRFIH